MMKSSGIGGQAVLEGVMMKNKNCYAVAVRKPNNEIEVKKEEFAGGGERRLLFKVPIFRGMATFVESLVLGMHALTYSSSFYEEEEGQKEVSKAKEALVDIGVVVMSIVMAVAIFILFPLFISSMLAKAIESETLQLVIEGFLRLFMFIAYIAIISRLNDIKRVFMYHGAEHKCINCVEQGYELTIANVKKQSKCHKRCGTSFMLVVMLVSFVLFMFIRVDAAWLRYVLRIVLIPVVAGISYEFIRLAGNTDNKLINFLSRPGLWMQGLTTREPDDSMIEVAIASVEAVFDWRAYQEKEGIAKYQKAPYGKKEKTTLPVSKDSKEEETASKGAPEGKVAAEPSRKESTPVAKSPRNEERQPAAKSIRREEKPAVKSGIKGERPATKIGIGEEKPATKIGIGEEKPATKIGIGEVKPAAKSVRPEKAVPKSGVKTIKPINKVDGKAEKMAADALIRKEKAAIRNGNQGEKVIAKGSSKNTKAVAKDINREIKALTNDRNKDKKMEMQGSGQKNFVKNEKTVAAGLGRTAAIEKENAGRPMQVDRKRPAKAIEERPTDTKAATAAKEDATVFKIQEIAISEEIVEEILEAALGEETAKELLETEPNMESPKEVLETILGEETVPDKEIAEEASEAEPDVEITEEASETVPDADGKIAEEASKAAPDVEIAEKALGTVPDVEIAEEASKTAPAGKVAEEASKTAPNRKTSKRASKATKDEKTKEEASEVALSEEAAGTPEQGRAIVSSAERQNEATAAVAATAEVQNEPKNRGQARRRNDLINFMAVPDDDEEEDEILRALDRYFVYDEEDSEENK